MWNYIDFDINYVFKCLSFVVYPQNSNIFNIVESRPTLVIVLLFSVWWYHVQNKNKNRKYFVSFSLYVWIYVYYFLFVCVCVCVRIHEEVKEQLHDLNFSFHCGFQLGTFSSCNLSELIFLLRLFLYLRTLKR